jgi:hypothetical protein
VTPYVAVAATVVAAAIGSWTALRVRRPRPAALRLAGTAYYVSVGPAARRNGMPSAVTEPRPLDPAEKINLYHLDRQYLYTADLRVVNDGGLPAVINRVEALISRSCEYYEVFPRAYQEGFTGALPASGEYGLTLPSPGGTDKRAEVSVAQEVRPAAVDRFLVHISVPGGGGGRTTSLYRMTLTVAYDTGGAITTDRPIILAHPDLPQVSTADEVGRRLEAFLDAVAHERAASGLALPPGLSWAQVSADAALGGLHRSKHFELDFWQPRKAVVQALDSFTRRAEELRDFLAPDGRLLRLAEPADEAASRDQPDAPGELLRARRRVGDTLDDLPAVRTELNAMMDRLKI